MTSESTAPSLFTTWSLLHQSYSLVYKNLDQLMSKNGISQAQASVLVVLESVGRPLPLSRLARLLVQEAQSVTSLVDRLEQRALVRRVPDSRDRRVINVQLTPEGEQLFEQLCPAARKGLEDIFSVLSYDEQQRLTNSLRRLRDRGADVLGLTRAPFDEVEVDGRFEPRTTDSCDNHRQPAAG